MNKAKQWASTFFRDLKTYWSTPKPGNYVSNREFVTFGLGWGASDSADQVVSNVSFAASCFLVGSIYGISFQDIFMIGVLGLPFGYLWNPINMVVTDNLGRPPRSTMRFVSAVLFACMAIGAALFFVPQARFERIVPGLPQILGVILVVSPLSIFYRMMVYRWLSPRFGKFSPWIVIGVIPTIAILLLMVYLPFEQIPYHNRLWTIYLLFMLYGIFNGFTKQVQNLTNVISPDTHERLRIMSYGVFISGIPSGIVGAVFPMIAMYTGGLNNIKTFRIVIPAALILLAPFTLLLAFNVKERVILEQDHRPGINMLDGFKEVLKNKYNWIHNLYQLCRDLEKGVINIANIIFIYMLRQDWMVGIYATVLNTAANPGKILAPILVKKFGKKPIFMAGRIVAILQLAAGYYAISSGNVWLFFILSYLGNIFNSASIMVRRAMQADVWDYQQWMSGERLDGCMGIFGMLLAPLTTLVTMAIPTAYAAVGFTSDWDILFSDIYRNKVFLASIALALVSTVLSIVPFLFYDLSEEKHRGIIEDLKARKAAQEEEASELAQV